MISARMTNTKQPITRWDNPELGRIVIHTAKNISGRLIDEFICLNAGSVVVQGDTPNLCEALAWLRGETQMEVHFDGGI